MAYCHIRDVGMKFDEHVYYMAGLFCCNIALSIALIPALIFTELRGSARSRQVMWAATGALAGATIVGFVWSRTIGFPQMADHIGEWDALGLTSVVFEGILVALSLVMLTQIVRPAGATSGRAGQVPLSCRRVGGRRDAQKDKRARERALPDQAVKPEPYSGICVERQKG